MQLVKKQVNKYYKYNNKQVGMPQYSKNKLNKFNKKEIIKYL